MYENNPFTEVSQMTQPEEKKGRGSGAFRKIALSICMGLLFGLFAGVGFCVVAGTSGMMSISAFSQGKDQATAAISEAPKDNGALPGAVISDSSAADSSITGQQTLTTADITGDNFASYLSYNGITSVVSKVMPSMVSIEETVITTSSSGFDFGFGFFGPSTQQTYESTASGSGIIIGETDDEYLIVTNNHVVADAESIRVTFINDKTVEAHVKGLNSNMDLAVIAVAKGDMDNDTISEIRIAVLGDSDCLQLGEPVVAIGNALGYGQSVTDGIVSALNREVTTEDGNSQKFIQTNAAINPGNSGGALLNLNGEVIGINSNKIGGSTVEGMGYAIPISAAKDIIANLSEKSTKVKLADEEKGFMGISLQEVTPALAQKFSMPVGIYIVSTVEGGPAANAGLQSGDIITEFDGTTISTNTDLTGLLQYYPGGTTVEITYQRQTNGEYQEFKTNITLGFRPSSDQ